MANIISLNTGAHPTITQVLVAFHDGSLFDFKAQQSAGSVTITDPKKKAAVLAATGPGRVGALNES